MLRRKQWKRAAEKLGKEGCHFTQLLEKVLLGKGQEEGVGGGGSGDMPWVVGVKPGARN